jgi:shikimate kinase
MHSYTHIYAHNTYINFYFFHQNIYIYKSQEISDILYQNLWTKFRQIELQTLESLSEKKAGEDSPDSFKLVS